MASPPAPAPFGFRPVAGAEALDRIRQFLVAQGWAGLALGDHLRRIEAEGGQVGESLSWVEGGSGEVRAAAIWHQRRLGILVPCADARPAALALLAAHRGELESVHLLEGQLDMAELDGLGAFPRELAVAPRLEPATRELPLTRPARPGDAEAVHRVYSEVGWMRQETSLVWQQRLKRERCWVAELAGEVVAAARWSMSFAGWVEVGGVATRSEFRRQGLGQAVTRAATAAALEEGRRVMLRFSDLALGALYHPIGFQPVGRERAFHRLG